MAFTVTVTQTANGYAGMSMTLKVLTGAAATQNGATALAGPGALDPAQKAITPDATGSIVFGAAQIYPASGSWTALASTTLYAGLQGEYTVGYGQWRSASTTTAATPVTLGISAPTGATNGGIAMAEILASGTLAIDASSPPVTAYASGATALTTASFTPVTGSLLVLMVSSNGDVGVCTVSVTDTSGLGLTWVPQAVEAASGAGLVGVYVAQMPSGGMTASAGQAAASGAAAGPLAGAATGYVYATADAAISGSWANLSYATGSTTGTYTTWTDSGTGTSAVLELSGFSLQSVIASGSTISQVRVKVRHSESPAAQVASITAQAYLATSPYGSPQALTVSDSVREDEVIIAGLAYADLADLRVRVTATRN
jgi:hypothetical protein